MSADIGIPPGFASIGITDAATHGMIGDALKDLSASLIREKPTQRMLR